VSVLEIFGECPGDIWSGSWRYFIECPVDIFLVSWTYLMCFLEIFDKIFEGDIS